MTRTATFRFHGTLGDFLPLSEGEETIACSFNPGQSAKHLVESLGIPHTEVATILVNGKPVDFNYLVDDGDQIQVFPNTAEELTEDPRFVLDNHLGRLAVYLRMLGFDSLYRNDFQDEELAMLASEQDRILLTRDRRLLMRNQVRRGYSVRSKTPQVQLDEVVRRYDLSSRIVPYRRCMRCNGFLQPVDKEKVLDQLKPLTRQYFDDFRMCMDCHQIYWKGSHYERMQLLIQRVMHHNLSEEDTVWHGYGMNEINPLLFPPALLSVPGITPQLLQSVFAAAADFYEVQPWQVLKSETVIEVCSPDPRLVVVMGAAGQSFGISVYDSQADLQRMYRAADPLDAAGALCWLALTFETAEYLDRGDIEAIDEFGWRVAGVAAYPAIARIGAPGPDLQPPGLQDLFWLEGCLRALCRFFTSYLVLDEQEEPRPIELGIPVETSIGVVETRLRLPGMQV